MLQPRSKSIAYRVFEGVLKSRSRPYPATHDNSDHEADLDNGTDRNWFQNDTTAVGAVSSKTVSRPEAEYRPTSPQPYHTGATAQPNARRDLKPARQMLVRQGERQACGALGLRSTQRIASNRLTGKPMRLVKAVNGLRFAPSERRI